MTFRIVTPLVRTQKASTSKPGLDHTPRKEREVWERTAFSFKKKKDVTTHQGDW